MLNGNYKRILILGSIGSGKTTLAHHISRMTNIKEVNLDKEYWLPNWTRPDMGDFIEKLQEIVKEDEWIIEGNYIESLDVRLERADLILVLDIDLKTCERGIFFRTLKGLFKKRKDLNDGCRDSFKNGYKELLEWARLFKKEYYPALLNKCFDKSKADLIIFKTRKAAHNYIKKGILK